MRWVGELVGADGKERKEILDDVMLITMMFVGHLL